MLEDYGRKRDFSKTAEPPPARKSRPARGPLTFVVQKHAARRLHYDFRLEFDGVLKSWPVPKGPSLDPNDKRLAVMVEDHPLDYASFEGVIPKGEYGAGQVIVWDCGTYSPDEDGKLSFDDPEEADQRMQKGLKAGKLSFFLRGRKLKGSWTLVKIARSEKDWLLIKHQDEFVDPGRDVTQDDRSVLSGLTIEDLKAGHLPDLTRAPAIVSPRELPAARQAPFPSTLEAMLPSLAEGPFSHPNWLFEPKLDGIRALALVRDGKVKLLSRRRLDSTKQYPALAQDLARQPERELVLDGEIVALDENGRPSFELLQQRMNLSREADIKRADSKIPVLYYAFDLLYVDGTDLRSVPLERRKDLLAVTLVPLGCVRLLEDLGSNGQAAYQAAVSNGLEGVVAKKRDSLYESGRRSHNWLKVKENTSDDFVVGGFDEGSGARADTFGALLLGAYDEQGQLVYCGHVGSGFDTRTLEDLRQRLEAIKTDERPFSSQPPLKGRATWVQPEMVVEVKFLMRTKDGLLRAPVFLRVRDDKAPKEATQADAVPTPAGVDTQSVGAYSYTPEPIQPRDIQDILEQLETKAQKPALEVQGHRIPLTNLDKELWPAHEKRRALTKRDFIAYLAKMSPYLLPHLGDRPLSLIRFPDGIHGERFFQKHWEHKLPEFVESVWLYSDHNAADGEYLLCNNLPTLLWLGQIASLELHTWYSRINTYPDGEHLSSKFTGSLKNIEASLLNYPDFIVFDLDPYLYSGKEAKGEEPELHKVGYAKTCEAAMWLKELLEALSLSSFVKTSGRTGLHIFVPILRQLDYHAVHSAARTLCGHLAAQHPREATIDWAVPKRTGKVFLDYNQNVRGKTVASVYSPRVSPEATVSTPLTWDEVGKVYPTELTMLTVPDRVARIGDLWANILNAKHDLRGLLDKAG